MHLAECTRMRWAKTTRILGKNHTTPVGRERPHRRLPPTREPSAGAPLCHTLPMPSPALLSGARRPVLPPAQTTAIAAVTQCAQATLPSAHLTVAPPLARSSLECTPAQPAQVLLQASPTPPPPAPPPALSPSPLPSVAPAASSACELASEEPRAPAGRSGGRQRRHRRSQRWRQEGD